MPRPAQPSPGVGPPASTQITPPYPSCTISSSAKSFLYLRTSSRTVAISPLPCRLAVESALGSHPICMTLYPISASAALTFETVVDFPMPPLPYTAIFIIFLSFLPVTLATCVTPLISPFSAAWISPLRGPAGNQKCPAPLSKARHLFSLTKTK